MQSEKPIHRKVLILWSINILYEKSSQLYQMLEISLNQHIYIVFNNCIAAYFLVFAGKLLKYIFQV